MNSILEVVVWMIVAKAIVISYRASIQICPAAVFRKLSPVVVTTDRRSRRYPDGPRFMLVPSLSYHSNQDQLHVLQHSHPTFHLSTEGQPETPP
jgi:hypothetical protein